MKKLPQQEAFHMEYGLFTKNGMLKEVMVIQHKLIRLRDSSVIMNGSDVQINQDITRRVSIFDTTHRLNLSWVGRTYQPLVLNCCVGNMTSKIQWQTHNKRHGGMLLIVTGCRLLWRDDGWEIRPIIFCFDSLPGATDLRLRHVFVFVPCCLIHIVG